MNTENNKLIAEFMGMSQGKPNENRWKNDWFEKLTTDGNEFESGRRHEHLLFDYSWDWLMLVAKKCVSLNDAYELDGHEQVNNAIQDALWTINIEEVHKAVVEFIKWYNTNKL